MTETQTPPDPSDNPEGAAQRAKQKVGDLRAQIENAESEAQADGLEALQILRDELDRWTVLLENRGESALGEANLQVHLGLMEVADRAAAMEDSFHDVVVQAKKKMGDAKTTLDVARLKTHLARLDAESEIASRAARVKEKVREAKEAARHPAVVAEREVTRLVHAWAKLYH